MALRSASNRYLNYGGYPTRNAADPCRSRSREGSPRQQHLNPMTTSCPSLTAANINNDGHHHHHYQQQQQQQQQQQPQQQERPTSSRLEYIINAMAYIRGELDDLKESDRVLMDIFKQLENNVAELSDSISTWRGGRPSSLADMDFNMSRSSYCESLSSPPHNFSGLETILDSSKEDLHKASMESDSLDLPVEHDEHEGSSSSCSPVLPSLKSHSGSINSGGGSSSISGGGGSSGGGGGTNKVPAATGADFSSQLRTSASFTSRLANSPSISRLQDETSSNISRNSSIDSGIQFASEAENGSANGVEPMQVQLQVLPPPPPVPAPSSSSGRPVMADDDVRKSVGFADDIFAVLGMK